MTLQFALILSVAALAATPSRAEQPDTDLIARGAYLGTIMDCAGCHMPRGPDGAPIVEAGLSGGTVGFEIPGLGTFWPSNLTPDKTGLGGWSGDDIIRAVTTGVRPDGRMLAPAMPWPGYAALRDDDRAALVAWLQSLEPVENPVPEPAAPGAHAPAPFYRVTMP
ncbi:cytochrome c [Phaeovulum sp.]|uniref:c-type cytochrome n=1 Tax=Phaeovulum sp. TaxID=2934796 RepID=UPI003562E072